jgi:hypothetical protein
MRPSRAPAAGNGWCVDAPLDDSACADDVSFPGQHAVGTSEPCARLGLLTAILHETGHALGLADAYEPTDRNEVMYGNLTAGARRVPVRGASHEERVGL